jgi:hypothetical protein
MGTRAPRGHSEGLQLMILGPSRIGGAQGRKREIGERDGGSQLEYLTFRRFVESTIEHYGID